MPQTTGTLRPRPRDHIQDIARLRAHRHGTGRPLGPPRLPRQRGPSGPFSRFNCMSHDLRVGEVTPAGRLPSCRYGLPATSGYTVDTDQPLYRVRIWERARPPWVGDDVPEDQRGWVPTVWSLADVEAPEVLEWARSEARGRDYEVHVCTP